MAKKQPGASGTYSLKPAAKNRRHISAKDNVILKVLI